MQIFFVPFVTFSCSIWNNFYSRKFLVRFGRFFARKTRTTATTTKLLLGPLSGARGQKIIKPIVARILLLMINNKYFVQFLVKQSLKIGDKFMHGKRFCFPLSSL